MKPWMITIEILALTVLVLCGVTVLADFLSSPEYLVRTITSVVGLIVAIGTGFAYGTLFEERNKLVKKIEQRKS